MSEAQPIEPTPVGAVSADGRWQWNGQQWMPVPQLQTVLAIKTPHPRDKSVAIILAAFLGVWTWVYTYDRDKSLFWGNLIASVLTGGLWIPVVWVWAIVLSCVRTSTWYRAFPNG